MDIRVQSFLDKVKDMAEKTGEAASCAADTARKKATELASATRLNLQIFDLNTECEVLYKEMGRMVYDLHRGIEVSNEAMDGKIAAVDAKQEKIAAEPAAVRMRSARAAAARCERIFRRALPYGEVNKGKKGV